MAKKSRKLSKDQIEKIVDDRTKFDVILSIETGLVATKNEDGTFSTSEETNLGEFNVVRIVFNDKIRKRIRKFAGKLFSMRGIKDIETIGPNDYDVQILISNWERRVKKQLGKRKIAKKDREQKVSTFIETIKREHRPQYLLAMFQLISWSILRDDIFTILPGNNIDCRFDIEIKEEYWDQKLSVEDDVDVDLDIFFDGYTAEPLTFDKTNSFEHMIGIVSEFLNQNEKLAEAFTDYYNKISVGLSMTNDNEEYDDAGFLNSRLDELLSGNDVEADIPEE